MLRKTGQQSHHYASTGLTAKNVQVYTTNLFRMLEEGIVESRSCTRNHFGPGLKRPIELRKKVGSLLQPRQIITKRVDPRPLGSYCTVQDRPVLTIASSNNTNGSLDAKQQKERSRVRDTMFFHTLRSR